MPRVGLVTQMGLLLLPWTSNNARIFRNRKNPFVIKLLGSFSIDNGNGNGNDNATNKQFDW